MTAKGLDTGDKVLAHAMAQRRIDPSLVIDAEVAWYLNEAIFLVSEDDEGVQGFACANHQTGYVWALFVIDGAQGRGRRASDCEENSIFRAGQSRMTSGAFPRA
jgi:hypothetical protein